MKTIIKFARFGGLSPVIQKGYTANNSERVFHSPPARKGFYAFIWPYYDFFLLGGSWSNVDKKNPKFEYLKDADGNRIHFEIKDEAGNIIINPKLKKFFVKNKNIDSIFPDDMVSDKIWNYNNFAVIKKSPKIFIYTGELWHHFKNKAIKPGDIIEEVGYWIKTDYDAFVRAFNYDKNNSLVLQLQLIGRKQHEINPKSPYKNIGRDHLEVFIERIK